MPNCSGFSLFFLTFAYILFIICHFTAAQAHTPSQIRHSHNRTYARVSSVLSRFSGLGDWSKLEWRTENRERRIENREFCRHTDLCRLRQPHSTNNRPRLKASLSLLPGFYLAPNTHTPAHTKTHTRANSRTGKRRPDIRIKSDQNAQTGSHCLRLRSHERERELLSFSSERR